jgi:RNA polymerase sigma factor (sigma-70 family)
VTELTLTLLRRLLIDDYSRLRQRLARRLGSADFAGEVLHEAWLRLDRMDAVPGVPLRNPSAYLYRMALNVAIDQKRIESRRLAPVEIDGLLRGAVEELDPARVFEARQELEVLQSALDNLSRRRREIFVASRLEGLSHKEIASRLGVTVRIVDRELKAALDCLGALLEKKSLPRRGPQPRKTS